MTKKDLTINSIISVILTVGIIALASFFGDHYFDLNDDVLIKDILSGAYTGTPAGHNIQMLYPVSAFIALLYRAFPAPDWCGIFLCACQYICIFIVLFRVLKISGSKVLKVIAAAVVVFFMAGCILPHFLFVQYTFTCGMLSATAAFLIMTGDSTKRGSFVPIVILIVLAYLIRSEMLLLTLPVVGVAILIKWLLTRIDIRSEVSEGVEISRYSEKKALFTSYVRLCVILLIGLAISQAIHIFSYSSQEWKDFNALFDARTELYDFQYIPDYAENKEFYDSINISEVEQKLLVNYNWGIDDEINTDVLNAVADYAAGLKTDETPLPIALVQSIPSYLYRMRHVAFQKSYEYPMTDAPLNIITAVLYLGVLLTFLLGSEKSKKLPAVFSLILLFACRSTLWLFIIVRGRDPIRITHPLYLMEIAVLLGMMFIGNKENSKIFPATLIVSAVVSALFVQNQFAVITDEMAERDKMRAHYDALYDYFDANEDSFYFIDVYTAVSATDGLEKTFSEKMFANVDNSEYNHDYMGGWASKSPLYYQKLEKNGFSSMQDALLKDNVYFIAKEGSDISWMDEFYTDKEIEVSVDKTETVAGVFNIYKITEVQ